MAVSGLTVAATRILVQDLGATVQPGSGRGAAVALVVGAHGGSRRESRARVPRLRFEERADADVIGCGPFAVTLRPGALAEVVAPQWADPTDAAFRTAMRVALTQALAQRGSAMVHGAAFAVGRRSVVVLGRGRAGKSSLALAGLRAGGRIVTDDLFLLARHRGRVVVRWLRGELVVRPGSARLVPRALRRGAVPVAGARDGAVSIARSRLGSSAVDTCVPSSLWVASVDRGRVASVAEPLDAPSAMGALMLSSTPGFLTGRFPVERDALLTTFRATVESCPAFRVRLGRRLLEEPEDEMRRLLELTRG